MAELRLYIQYDWPYDDRFVYRRIRYDDILHQINAIEAVFLSEVEGTTLPIIKENEWKTIYKSYNNGEKRYIDCRGVAENVEAQPLTAAYTPLSITASKVDPSGYKEDNGEISFTLSGGTGESISFYFDKGLKATSYYSTKRRFTSLSPGTYTGRAVDSGDKKEVQLQVEIIEPVCNLLIDRIEATAETAPGALDGTITIYAQSSNPLEFNLSGPVGFDWTRFGAGIQPKFTGLSNGLYTVGIRDQNQIKCTQSRSIAVEELACQTAIVNVSVIHESYIGKADGQIHITAESNRAVEYRLEGVPLADLPWQTSGSFYNLAPGSYDIVVRDIERNQCEARSYALIKQGDSFRADLTHIVCGGSATGRFHINRNNNIAVHGPHTFLWEDGSTEQKRNDLRAGSYTVQIKNARGVTTEITGEITENPPIMVVANIDSNNIYLSVSGGVPPYAYLWEDGSTLQNRQNLDTGMYRVTVSDSIGCSTTENIYLRIPQHYFSENTIALDVYALDLHLKPNFTFICEVWIEPEYLSGNFIRVAELEQSVNEAGQTVFQVEEYINAYLEPELPEIYSGVRRLDKQFKRFYLKYTEKYGSPPELSEFSQQETFYCLLGGLNFEETATKDFFLNYLPEEKPFYSWLPKEKEVFPEQPEFLYFLIHQKTLTEFIVFADLYYLNGERETIELFRRSGLKQYEIYSFPAGFDQLSLGGYNCGEPPYRYDIYITDPGGVYLSEVRSYYLINEFYPQKRFFFFLNSLGCFDTLAATGKAVYELKTQSEKAEKILPYNYKRTDRPYQIVSKYGELEVNVPLGFADPDLLERLQDFVISKEYYLYEKNRLLPVDIEVNRATIHNEDENLQSLEFTFSPPRLSKYTPLLRPPVRAAFAAEYTIKPATTGTANGSITVTPAGGISPYSYLWSDGITTQNRTGLPAGSYSVRISDSSTPRRALSLCDLIIEEQPATGPTYSYSLWPHYVEDPAFYYAAAPGYKYTMPATASRSVGQLLIRNMIFPIGITRISFYVYLPAGFQFGNTIPEISADFGGVGSSYTKVTTGTTASRGVWQKIEIDAKVTKEVEHEIYTKIEIDKNADTPHYWLSDLSFTFLS